MNNTQNAEKAQTLGEWYIAESGGDLVRYHQGLRAGHRIGQAFFNALTSDDQARLTGTLVDPFYRNTSGEVAQAITFLTAPDTRKSPGSELPGGGA